MKASQPCASQPYSSEASSGSLGTKATSSGGARVPRLPLSVTLATGADLSVASFSQKALSWPSVGCSRPSTWPFERTHRGSVKTFSQSSERTDTRLRPTASCASDALASVPATHVLGSPLPISIWKVDESVHSNVLGLATPKALAKASEPGA